ncbi:hypothetical protein NP493_631g00001 [Ridgeia piscesae]|uniref:Uncharacterized protein n=1 Tax=Ridgeia piscesae TaxID=27915 RepID=A0AAD9NNU7_RIDPI|nr:hypothetical protein NP493_631g00001 [Ridgeia piscesae]
MKEGNLTPEVWQVEPVLRITSHPLSLQLQGLEPLLFLYGRVTLQQVPLVTTQVKHLEGILHLHVEHRIFAVHDGTHFTVVHVNSALVDQQVPPQHVLDGIDHLMVKEEEDPVLGPAARVHFHQLTRVNQF